MGMDKLKKVLSLVKKTNDKCIITDIDSDEIFVVMTLDEYESQISNIQQKKLPLNDIKQNSNDRVVTERIIEKQPIVKKSTFKENEESIDFKPKTVEPKVKVETSETIVEDKEVKQFAQPKTNHEVKTSNQVKTDSENELLAKINRDVANWKAANGDL